MTVISDRKLKAWTLRIIETRSLGQPHKTKALNEIRERYRDTTQPHSITAIQVQVLDIFASDIESFYE